MKVTSTLTQLGQAIDDGISVTITGTDDATGDQVAFALDRLRFVAEVGALLRGTGLVTFEVTDRQVIDRQPVPAFRWSHHLDDDGAPCSWSGVSAPARLDGDHPCPRGCKRAHLIPADQP